MPPQRVPQPPALRHERRKRALHLVFRASADATATSERQPAPSVETQPGGHEEQQPAEDGRSGARDQKSEQRRDDACQRRFAGVSEPAILLSAGVVHAAAATS